MTGDALRLHAFANAGSVASPDLVGAFKLARATYASTASTSSAASTLSSALQSTLQPLATDVFAAVGVGLHLRTGSFHVELNYCVPAWSPSGAVNTSMAPHVQFGVGFEFL
jgi:hypothetical protein